MSDLGDGGGPVTPDTATLVYTGKECDEEGCVAPIPKKDEPGFSPARKKCDLHFVGQKANPRKERKAPTDKRPINVNLGANPPKGKNAEEKRVEKVTAGASQMCKTLGMMLAMGGDKECGEAFLQGADAWGQAIGELSRYQPWLAKVFAPTGEITGQGLAWISVVAASAGIAIPVMAHHNLVSPALANKFAAGGMAIASMADADDPD